MKRALFAVVAGVALAACGGGGGGGDGGGPAQVSIAPAGVFLPGVGQTRTLTATVVDQAGHVSAVPVTWTSSAPSQISVDASGKLTAMAIGSAQIAAQAGGVWSQPVLVVVAEPAPGALLVTDAQVVSVGDVIGLAAGEFPDPGMQYEVRLQGVSPAPDPGTILLAAELSPVAGRVVSTRTDSGDLVVVLELVTLPELVRNASIDWDLDLSTFSWSDAPASGAARALSTGPRAEGSHALLFGGGDIPLKPFQPFKCSGSLNLDAFKVTHTFTPTANLHLLYAAGVTDGLPAGEARVELTGTFSLDGLVKIALTADLGGTADCTVQQLTVLPVTGWFARILAPAVKVGLGLKASADLKAAVAELDLKGKAGLSFSMGISCPAGGDCSEVQQFTPTGEVDPTFKTTSDPALRLVLDAYLYGSVSLDAAIGGGNVGDVELLAAKIGPDQTTDLAFEDAQAKDESYASSDKLKWKGNLTAGGGVAKILTELGAKAAGTAVSKLQLDYSHDICRSPTGALSVDKATVARGQKLQVSVDLDQANLDYVGFPDNVTEVTVWRRMQDASTFEPLRTLTLLPTPLSSATHYQGTWVPTDADLGTNSLAAFVTTKLDTDVAYELAPSTLKQVDVVCFTPAGAGTPPAAGAPSAQVPAATSCQDQWTATLTYDSGPPPGGQSLIHEDASVTFKSISTTGTVIQYQATGTLGLRFNPTDCTYVLTPASFTYPTGSLLDYSTLAIDYGQDPPSYNFALFSAVDFTSLATCPTGDVTTPFMGFPIQLAGHGNLVTAADASFTGTTTAADGTLQTWNFSR